VFPYIDETSPYKLEMVLRVKACFPKNVKAIYAVLKFAVPKLTSSVHNELQKVTLLLNFSNIN
jgi:hypothetical protein